MSLNRLSREVHRTAREKGFWKGRELGNPLSDLSELMLITTEVAEAAEAIRKGDDENYAEELVDIIIRVFDSAAARNIDLDTVFEQKTQKNNNRSYMHGGKLA